MKTLLSRSYWINPTLSFYHYRRRGRIMLSVNRALPQGSAHCTVPWAWGGSRVCQTNEEAWKWMLWRCTCWLVTTFLVSLYSTELYVDCWWYRDSSKLINLGKWRNTVDVAVKTLKPGAMTAEDFLGEAKLMHKLRHRKLVQLLAVCTTSEPILIITELMIHGALLDYLRKDEGRTLKFVVLVDMASQASTFIGIV